MGRKIILFDENVKKNNLDKVKEIPSKEYNQIYRDNNIHINNETIYQVDVDKYISVQDYIMTFKYPLTNFDYLLFELINFIGNAIDTKYKLAISKMKSILINVLISAKDFYKGCLSCENSCLTQQDKKMNYDLLRDFGVDPQVVPLSIKKKIKLNYFYLELANIICKNINYELDNLISKNKAYDISSEIYYMLLDYISYNCWESCNNRCVKGHLQNSYCEFCIIADLTLPCPQKKEVSLQELHIKESELMLCNGYSISKNNE